MFFESPAVVVALLQLSLQHVFLLAVLHVGDVQVQNLLVQLLVGFLVVVIDVLDLLLMTGLHVFQFVLESAVGLFGGDQLTLDLFHLAITTLLGLQHLMFELFTGVVVVLSFLLHVLHSILQLFILLLDTSQAVTRQLLYLVHFVKRESLLVPLLFDQLGGDDVPPEEE